jgi:hypothetical protein
VSLSGDGCVVDVLTGPGSTETPPPSHAAAPTTITAVSA